jgi:drug/metabolite transporter (DMT)-like permease
VIGALMLVGGGGAVHWAEQFVPSSVTVLIITTVPVWMVLLHWFQRDERAPSIAEISGVVLGFGGVLLLVGAGDLGRGQPVDRLGALVLVLGSLSWAFGSVYSSRLKLPDSPLLAPSMEMLCGGVLLVVLGLARGEAAALNITAITGKSVISFVYLVILGSIVTFTAYVWLLRVSTPARVSTYAFVNPVVAVLLGCTLGKEPFTSRCLMSAVIIVAAVVLITMWRGRRARANEPAVLEAEAFRCDLELGSAPAVAHAAGRGDEADSGRVAVCE